MLISPNVSVGINKRRAIPESSLPVVLQNRDVLIYGQHLAETYAVGDPMPTVGQPAFTAIDAAREATFRKTPGGFGYARFTLDAYGKTGITPGGTASTIAFNFRDWTSDFSAVGFRENSARHTYIQLRASEISIVTANIGSHSIPLTALQDGWNSIAHVSTTNGFTTYLNGVEAASTVRSTPLSTTPLPFVVGRQAVSDDPYANFDCQLVMYDASELTASEIAQISDLRPTS